MRSARGGSTRSDLLGAGQSGPVSGQVGRAQQTGEERGRICAFQSNFCIVQQCLFHEHSRHFDELSKVKGFLFTICAQTRQSKHIGLLVQGFPSQSVSGFSNQCYSLCSVDFSTAVQLNPLKAR